VSLLAIAVHQSTLQRLTLRIASKLTPTVMRDLQP
jgi:hypothetical protein